MLMNQSILNFKQNNEIMGYCEGCQEEIYEWESRVESGEGRELFHDDDECLARYIRKDSVLVQK